VNENGRTGERVKLDRSPVHSIPEGKVMENSLGNAAVWMGLALVASLLSIRFNVSVALVEPRYA
jgi:hypothetical protein